MNFLQPAQAGAQVLSLIVFATIARWYVAPWLKTLGRADALVPLLWVHVFRYVALQAFSAQRNGFPISDGGLIEIVVGDVAGMFIAFATIVALRASLSSAPGNSTGLAARCRDDLRYRHQHTRRDS